MEARYLKRKNDSGAEERFYPITHANAVVGLIPPVPLDGSGAMTGNLFVKKDTPEVILKEITNNRFIDIFLTPEGYAHFRNATDNNNHVTFYLQQASADKSRLVRMQHTVNGVSEYFNLYGEHNKPSGSYTGNGSVTKRVIDTGGLSNVCVIYDNTSGFYGAIVCPFGAILKTDQTLVKDRGEVYFANGVLTINSAHHCLNESGREYYYYVL